MRNLVILSGHKNFNSGGVGTHLRVLNDALTNGNHRKKVVLGKSRYYDLKAFLINKSSNSTLTLIENQINGLESNLSKSVTKDEDIVDCHDLYAVIAAYRLRKKQNFNFKINYTVHAPFYEQFLISNKKIKTDELNAIKKLELEALNYCDGFVFVDDKQLSIIKDKIGKDIDFIMLPNAVDLKMLSNFKKKEQTEEYIIVSRHLFKKNGVHVAIEAFAKANLPNNVQMLILGMGDEYENLSQQVEKLDLKNRVILKGSLKFEDSINYTINAKMALVPSIPLGDYIEATSLSMLEAMALGVPLIASNIGGLKQVLENTGAGILVEPNNIEELSDAINLVYSDTDLSNNLVKVAQNLILEKYSSGPWLDKKLKFLSTL